KKSLGLDIEPPDRPHARPKSVRKKIHHGVALLGIRDCRHVTPRFLQKDVGLGARALMNAPAVHLHGVGRKIGALAEHRDASIDPHPALPNPLLRLAAGSEARFRENLLKTDGNHGEGRESYSKKGARREERLRAGVSFLVVLAVVIEVLIIIVVILLGVLARGDDGR